MKNLAGKELRMGIRLDTSFWTERYYLSTGWCEFRRYNKLSEGDKCVFKYIRSESKLCLAKVTKKEMSVPPPSSCGNITTTNDIMKRKRGHQPHQQTGSADLVMWEATQAPCLMASQESA